MIAKREKWEVTFLTIFPEMFPGPLGFSLAGKGLKNDVWSFDVEDIRSYSKDRHHSIDDTPFGGGKGMVMRPDVLARALDAHKEKQEGKEDILIYPSPRGEVFTQKKAYMWIKKPRISFLCGRFEGIDQRILDAYAIEEISIGDFVLSGGELAAQIMADSCVRLLPGILTSPEALEEESFGSKKDYSFLLEYPHYTQPASWRGHEVPEILRSGHHKNISEWRLEQSKKITKERRKDLWEKYCESNKL